MIVLILLYIRKTNSIVSQIKFGVITTNENIAQYPQWAIGWWNINTHKTRYAHGLSKFRYLGHKKIIINHKKKYSHFDDYSFKLLLLKM